MGDDGHALDKKVARTISIDNRVRSSRLSLSFSCPRKPILFLLGTIDRSKRLRKRILQGRAVCNNITREYDPWTRRIITLHSPQNSPRSPVRAWSRGKSRRAQSRGRRRGRAPWTDRTFGLGRTRARSKSWPVPGERSAARTCSARIWRIWSSWTTLARNESSPRVWTRSGRSLRGGTRGACSVWSI